MSDIQSERRDSTTLITLDNPEAFNALTPTMTSGLVAALREAAADRTCRSIVLTGRRVYADEALSTGLVRRVVPVSEVVDAALEIGEQIAKLAPMAVTMTKETMWANLQAPSLDHALAFESRTQVMTRNTGDAAEARLAFLEKRDPVFDTPDNPRPVR